MRLSLLRERWICLALLQVLAEWQVEKVVGEEEGEEEVKKVKISWWCWRIYTVLQIERTRISLGFDLNTCGEEARKQEIESWSRGRNGRVAGMVWELLSVLSLILAGGDVKKQQIDPRGWSGRF